MTTPAYFTHGLSHIAISIYSSTSQKKTAFTRYESLVCKFNFFVLKVLLYPYFPCRWHYFAI